MIESANWFGKLVINTGGVRVRKAWNEDGECFVKERKLRIVHPAVLVMAPIAFVIVGIVEGFPRAVEAVKKNVCIF